MARDEMGRGFQGSAFRLIPDGFTVKEGAGWRHVD
jgi:hypothetical protein